MGRPGPLVTQPNSFIFIGTKRAQRRRRVDVGGVKGMQKEGRCVKDVPGRGEKRENFGHQNHVRLAYTDKLTDRQVGYIHNSIKYMCTAVHLIRQSYIVIQ